MKFGLKPSLSGSYMPHEVWFKASLSGSYMPHEVWYKTFLEWFLYAT